MKQLKLLVSMSLLWSLVGVSILGADVKLPTVIGDNMVLQQGRKIPIWGQADPGEKVTVTLGKDTATATADRDGRWMVKLKKQKAGGPHEVTITANSTITLKNVLIGEVWVCSGQSNMQMSVTGVRDAPKEIAEADYPNIHLFAVPNVTAAEPQRDCKGSWVTCSPQTVPGFSAVGYFFGRELHRKLGVPIGLINTSWGGTPAETWTSRAALDAVPDLHPLLDRWDQTIANYPQAKAKWDQDMVKWKEAADKAKTEGKPAPQRPWPPQGTDSPHRPGNLYNGMISPLIPYAIAGAIWYQGESNAGRAYEYRTLFPTMIQNWRKDWRQGDFPFLFVQLANFMQTRPDPVDSAWAELRESQTRTLSLPKTGMAVIIDIGEASDIHPKNKQDVGYRLALAAEKITYKQNIVFSGPTYKSMKIEGDKVRLSFRNLGSGLVARDGETLKGFAVAGEDKKFVWADATIEGNTIVVRSDQVAKPVAVRYAWADNPVCNLYNKEGLPASPFRTDDFPMVTAPK